jgi:hypothetical protein
MKIIRKEELYLRYVWDYQFGNINNIPDKILSDPLFKKMLNYYQNPCNEISLPFAKSNRLHNYATNK